MQPKIAVDNSILEEKEAISQELITVKVSIAILICVIIIIS